MSSLSFLSISSLFSLWAVFLRYPSIWQIACRNGRDRWHGGRAGEGWRAVSRFKFELVAGRGWAWRVWVLLGMIGSVHSRCASLSSQIESWINGENLVPEQTVFLFKFSNWWSDFDVQFCYMHQKHSMPNVHVTESLDIFKKDGTVSTKLQLFRNLTKQSWNQQRLRLISN